MASNEYFRGKKEKINKQLQKLSKKEQIKPQKRTALGIIKGITEIGQMNIWHKNLETKELFLEKRKKGGQSTNIRNETESITAELRTFFKSERMV